MVLACGDRGHIFTLESVLHSVNGSRVVEAVGVTRLRTRASAFPTLAHRPLPEVAHRDRLCTTAGHASPRATVSAPNARSSLPSVALVRHSPGCSPATVAPCRWLTGITSRSTPYPRSAPSPCRPRVVTGAPGASPSASSVRGASRALGTWPPCPEPHGWAAGVAEAGPASDPGATRPRDACTGTRAPSRPRRPGWFTAP